MKIIDEPFFIQNESDRKSFRNQYWQTALLEKGDLIYRIYTPGHNYIKKTLANRKNPATDIGSCWFDAITHLKIFQGANNSQYIQILVARSILAVKEEWNPTMSKLATAEIESTLKAAYGLINWQPLSDNIDKRNVILMGGGHQFFILLEDADKITVVGDKDISPSVHQ